MRAIALFCMLVCAHARFTRLVVFGDSLSDNGVNAVDRHGKKRHSTGGMWNEYLAKDLCLGLYSYATGGAKTDMNGFIGYDNPWSGIKWQIGRYLKENGNKVPSTDLIAYQSGGVNDLSATAEQLKASGKNNSPPPDRQTLEAIMQELKDTMIASGTTVITNNTNNIATLVKAGARNLIAIGLMNPEDHPYLREDAEKLNMTSDLKDFVKKANGITHQALSAHAKNYTGAKLVMLDFGTEKLKAAPYNLKMDPFPDDKSSTYEGQFGLAYMQDKMHLSDRANRGLADNYLKVVKREFKEEPFCSGAGRLWPLFCLTLLCFYWLL